MSTLTISRFLDNDLQAGNLRIIGVTFCDDNHVAVVENTENGSIWHYLADPWTTGEIAHTVECCRLPKGE